MFNLYFDGHILIELLVLPIPRHILHVPIALLGYTSPPLSGSVASPLQWLSFELAIKYACRLSQAENNDISIKPEADGSDHAVTNLLRLFLHCPRSY
jgi:hypothetical protein